MITADQINIFAAIVGLVLTGGTTLVLVCVWLVSRINGTGVAATKEVNSLEDKMRMLIDKEKELGSKQRHDLANNVHVNFNEFRRELEAIKKDGVRRDELLSVESRLAAMISEIKGTVERQGDKWAAQLDRAVEKIEGKHAGSN